MPRQKVDKPLTHAERQAQYISKKKARGLCNTCKGIPRPGYATCDDCLEKAKSKYAKPKIGISEARIIVGYIHESGINDEAEAIKYAFNKHFKGKA